MLASVRKIKATRYGEYLQVGDKPIFVYVEGSFNKDGLQAMTADIGLARFTDGSTNTDSPVTLANADEDTKISLKKYYGDLRDKRAYGVPLKLIY